VHVCEGGRDRQNLREAADEVLVLLLCQAPSSAPAVTPREISTRYPTTQTEEQDILLETQDRRNSERSKAQRQTRQAQQHFAPDRSQSLYSMRENGRRSRTGETPAATRVTRPAAVRAAKKGRGGGRRAGAGAAALCLGWSSVLLGGVWVADVVRADDSLNVVVSGAFDFAGDQLTVMNEEVLIEEGVFTDYTDEDGQWETTKENGDPIGKEVWTSGMVAGMFWYQYAATGNLAMKTAAEFYCTGLEGVELLDDNDLGFQVLNSYGLGYRWTNSTSDKQSYLERVLAGAATLHENRWDGNIPAYWSWENPSQRPEWERAVNVDMIMNMEIMLWAHVNGGDDHDEDVEGHADLTWLDIVRDDNSTNHVADYDPDTGEFVETGTYQGYTDDSTWTRGQAWAVYGYVMIYRYLAMPRFLERSIGLLEYFDSNLPDDLVPPSDFDAPVSATSNGKDSSATAIVASASIELFLSTDDAAYLIKGQNYLSALLVADYYLPDATDGYQSILRRATAAWGDPEVGATFGDYFLLECMFRYINLAPSILLFEEDAVDVVGVASTARRRRLEEAQGEEEEEEEDEETEPRRLQQVLLGGEFCAISVSGVVVAFADSGCVPVAPDFSVLESGTTPAPVGADATPSPTAGSRGEETVDTPAPSSPVVAATFAPLVVGMTMPPTTPAPTAAPATATPVAEGETPAPIGFTETPVLLPTPGGQNAETMAPLNTAGGSPAPTAPEIIATAEPAADTTAGASLEFGALELNHDVDLSYLDAASTVVVRFSVDLENTSNTPATLSLQNADGDVLETDVTAPDGGWQPGSNKVVFDATWGTFTPTAWTSVSSVVVEFEASATAVSGTTTTATVEWLIITNELNL
ncbi:unnamed protein product, partial [Pylaiella littoralis]